MLLLLAAVLTTNELVQRVSCLHLDDGASCRCYSQRSNDHDDMMKRRRLLIHVLPFFVGTVFVDLSYHSATETILRGEIDYSAANEYVDAHGHHAPRTPYFGQSVKKECI